LEACVQSIGENAFYNLRLNILTEIFDSFQLLLEYLIKTGTEKVAQQCKENIYAIQTLKDFQYMEEGKDQGTHVREKAKQLVSLLKDDERLKNERARALKAKERFARTASGFGSDGSIDGPSTREVSSAKNFSLEIE
jgi:epsin